MNITVTVESVDNTDKKNEKKLIISIPRTEIDAEIQKRLIALVPKVSVNGFRKGKVPLKLVQARFTGHVTEEVLNDKVKETYFKAIEQENLHPVSMPRMELPKTKDVLDTPANTNIDANIDANIAENTNSTNSTNSANTESMNVENVDTSTTAPSNANPDSTTNDTTVATTNATAIPAIVNDPNFFTYYAFVEMYPEITIGDLNQIEIEKYTAQVTDEDVENKLNELRKKRAEWIKVADTQYAIQKGDKLLIDFTTKIHPVVNAATAPSEAIQGEGKEEDKDKNKGKDVEKEKEKKKEETTEKNVEFEVGSGEMWEEFEAPLIGKERGAELEFTLTFPETHIDKDMAGKTADFKVKIKEVEVAKLPEINDEFTKAYGVETGGIDALRAKIRQNMEKEVEYILRQNLHDEITKKLVALHADSFVAPQSFVEEEIDRMSKDLQERFASLFGNKHSFKLPRTYFTEKAQQKVMASMLIARIIEDNNITVDTQQAYATLEKRFDNDDEYKKTMAWLAEDEKRLDATKENLKAEEAFKFIEQKAKVHLKEIGYKEVLQKRSVN